MTDQYELYCLTDPDFYDAPRSSSEDDPGFAVTGRQLPSDWEHVPSDTWMYYVRRDHALPAQGWKIHVSSGLDDAERVLATVWDYCLEHDLAFKFLRSRAVLVMFNSKAAARGSSGKLVTIYPTDVDQLELVLKELDALLAGVAGPYILSDLRYGDGPLFVRYGGFAERHCLDDAGERVLALENADGTLVPDRRGPTFALPGWITLPTFLESHLAARNAVTVAELPYRIESVLQFSNGGGVYLGRDQRTGSQVVLKEARPLAGLDVSGRDAVSRLEHEREILERLAGLDVVPAVVDHFELGEHRFLVTEFLDANPLQRELVRRFPLTHPDCDDAARATYTTWALDALDRVERAVAELHGRGVVFGDLHPSNVLLTDDRLILIDFEVATLVEDAARPTLAHPAFQPPADRRGVEVDRYALACLRLGLFAPQATIMVPLCRAKVSHLAEMIVENFPVPAGLIESAVAEILGDAGSDREPTPATGARAMPPMPGRASWADVREAISVAVLASATPERQDRLFPGDVAQFLPGGGLNLAHGAAGVLHALAVTGAGRFPEHEDWLRNRARSDGRRMRPGFYDGLHGVSYVLDAFGYRQDALDTAECAMTATADAIEPGLYSGLSGIGLNLLHLADRTGESGLLDRAMRIVGIVADGLGGPDDLPEISGGDHPRAGLMHGSSGPALLFLHAYERSGDSALLDLAGVALRQDLRRCTEGADGTLQVDQGWRTLPYLDEGSVGIALVLARYLAHREDAAFRAALPALEAITSSGYFVQSGLFAGRAGILAAAGMRKLPTAPALVRDLAWHALPYGGGLAFPGDQMMRLSTDLATGSAGVLLALGTALHDRPVALPFLDEMRPVPVTAAPTTSRERPGGQPSER